MTKVIVGGVVVVVAVGGAALRHGRTTGEPAAGIRAAGGRDALPAGAEASRAAQPDAGRHSPELPSMRTSAAARPLPNDFQILSSRSIFASKAAPAASQPAAAPKGAGPNALTLKGIAQRGTHFVAFFEQSGGGGVLELHDDSPLGGGRVVDLTLHSLAYQAGGKVTRVEVGQTIDAAALAVSSADAPAADPGQIGPALAGAAGGN